MKICVSDNLFSIICKTTTIWLIFILEFFHDRATMFGKKSQKALTAAVIDWELLPPQGLELNWTENLISIAKNQIKKELTITEDSSIFTANRRGTEEVAKHNWKDTFTRSLKSWIRIKKNFIDWQKVFPKELKWWSRKKEKHSTLPTHKILVL